MRTIKLVKEFFAFIQSKLLLILLVISIQSCSHTKLKNPSVETINVGSEKSKPIRYPKQFIIDELKHLLYLYDSTQKKIIRYNFSGNFINEIQVDAYLRSVMIDENSDTFWAYIADLPNVKFNTTEKSKPLKFIKIDQQGNIVDYITGENSISFRLEFSYIMLKQSNESVLFVEPLNESVFNFDGRHIAIFMPLFMNNVSMFAIIEPKELLTKKTLTGGFVSPLPAFGEEDNPIIVQYELK